MSTLLAGYFLAAYPDAASSLELFKKVSAYLDIFEIGYPSKNPVFDGDIIRKAHQDVMSRNCPNLSYWQALRSVISKPLWIMAYKADFIDTGLYHVFADQKLADVFVLPDCTDNERAMLGTELIPKGIEVMGFANPAMSQEEFKLIANTHKKIYFQLYIGKTGSEGIEPDPLSYLKTARSFPGLKVFAGFGISTAEKTLSLMEQGFDGVIIGTAFLKALNESKNALLDLIRDISGALKT